MTIFFGLGVWKVPPGRVRVVDDKLVSPSQVRLVFWSITVNYLDKIKLFSSKYASTQ